MSDTEDKQPKKRGVRKGEKRGKYRPRKRRIGGDRPLYKLTPEQVEAIWKLLQQKAYSQTEIARMFGVGQEAISHINTGTRWNEITGLPRRNKHSTDLPPSGTMMGRPRHNILKAQKKKPLKAHYAALQDACLKALLSGQPKIELRLPRRFKAPSDWPMFLSREIDGSNMVCCYYAKELLDWLYENKHSVYNSKDVRSMSAQVRMKISLAGLDLGMSLFKDELGEYYD